MLVESYNVTQISISVLIFSNNKYPIVMYSWGISSGLVSFPCLYPSVSEKSML